ncbi:hypothetical protein T06_129 [Trichinella sp. T6]|nr:hypothetical protein T06_129 [Trichinella sp. T6]
MWYHKHPNKSKKEWFVIVADFAESVEQRSYKS